MSERYRQTGLFASGGHGPSLTLLDPDPDPTREIVLEHTGPSRDGYELVSRLAGDDVLDAGVDGVETTTVAELLTL
jgi:hypothetical protein